MASARAALDAVKAVGGNDAVLLLGFDPAPLCSKANVRRAKGFIGLGQYEKAKKVKFKVCCRATSKLDHSISRSL